MVPLAYVLVKRLLLTEAPVIVLEAEEVSAP
jgi:hypothetical protein